MSRQLTHGVQHSLIRNALLAQAVDHARAQPLAGQALVLGRRF
jgi:hypothetical protein